MPKKKIQTFEPQSFETLVNTASGKTRPGARVQMTVLPRFCATTHDDGVSDCLFIQLTPTLKLHIWRTRNEDEDTCHVTLFDASLGFSLPLTIEDGDALFLTTPDGELHDYPIGPDSDYQSAVI